MATARTRTTSSSRTARAKRCGWCCAPPSAAQATASWCPCRRYVFKRAMGRGGCVGVWANSSRWLLIVLGVLSAKIFGVSLLVTWIRRAPRQCLLSRMPTAVNTAATAVPVWWGGKYANRCYILENSSCDERVHTLYMTGSIVRTSSPQPKKLIVIALR